MEWEILHGAAVRAMVEHLEKQGKPIPERFQPPELLPSVVPWLEAFGELSTERGIGAAGCGPIPVSAIKAYCREWPQGMRQAFVACIRDADAVWMELSSKSPEDDERFGLPIDGEYDGR